jgi:YesN/AraC family two-component response regulator
MRKVLEASNMKEVNSLVEEMIQEFCKAVNTQRNMNCSKLTQCLLYYLEHQYYQEITNEMLAEELDTSVYYLIRKCKKETGTTPQALLRKIRLTPGPRSTACRA